MAAGLVAITPMLAADALTQKQAGDEVAREHEEHIDADVSARQERHLGVVQRDQQDRERAHSLKVSAALGRDGTPLPRLLSSGVPLVCRLLASPRWLSAHVRLPLPLAPARDSR